MEWLGTCIYIYIYCVNLNYSTEIQYKNAFVSFYNNIQFKNLTISVFYNFIVIFNARFLTLFLVYAGLYGRQKQRLLFLRLDLAWTTVQCLDEQLHLILDLFSAFNLTVWSYAKANSLCRSEIVSCWSLSVLVCLHVEQNHDITGYTICSLCSTCCQIVVKVK
jgi:hypothetical protein